MADPALVDPSRELVLSGATFTGDQNGGGSVGDFLGEFQNASRRRAVGDPNDSGRRTHTRGDLGRENGWNVDLRGAGELALRGIAFGFRRKMGMRGMGVRDVGKIEAFGGAPETFEIVIVPGGFAENVDDKETIIEQHPIGAPAAFAMLDAAARFIELFFDGSCDGRELRGARARTDQKIIRERTGARKIEHGNIQGLLFLRGFNGPANFFWERV